MYVDLTEFYSQISMKATSNLSVISKRQSLTVYTNITEDHLNGYGLHINGYGTRVLAKNLISRSQAI